MSAEQLRAVTINDQNTVAYMRTETVITFPRAGVFHEIDVLDPDSRPRRVIRMGDALFGQTVTGVGTLTLGATCRYLNNSGQLAFAYSLSDGTRGIAVATPAGK